MDFVKINKENKSEVVGMVGGGVIVETKKNKKANNDKLPLVALFGLVLLMPIFYLPFTASSIPASKTALLGAGALLILFFWLVSGWRAGSLNMPKSLLIFTSGGLFAAWLLSAFFSGQRQLSLLGKIYDLDTVAIVFFMVLLLFMAANLLQTEKRLLNFYLAIFVSSIAVFVFQSGHIFFNIGGAEFFPFKSSNLIGSWSDFSIFFGFIGIVSLSFLEFSRFGRKMRAILYFFLGLSFLAMIISNFFANWIVLSLFALFLFIRFISPLFFPAVHQIGNQPKYLSASLFVLAAATSFLFLSGGPVASLSDKVVGSFVEVRPSWSATWNIFRQSVKVNPILGDGPNTFSQNWAKFKPTAINSSTFWNTRFSSGAGYFPSGMITVGLVGTIAWAAFFLVFIFSGWKIFASKQKKPEETIAKISFVGAAYLWTFTFIHSPGPLVLFLAFLTTGAMIGSLLKIEEIKLLKLNIARGNKGRAFSFLVIALLIGTSAFFYVHSKRVLAFYNYNQALKVFNRTGNIDQATKKIISAANLDKQDEYYQALSELELLMLDQLIADKSTNPEILKKTLEQHLKDIVAYAIEITRINQDSFSNWMQSGRIYESIASLKIIGADAQALASYFQAAQKSPNDPSPYLAASRVSLLSNKAEDAKKYLDQALVLKPDYSDALFLSAQLEVQQGNLKNGISRLEQAASSAPSAQAFFQLGLLYIQDNNLNSARFAFEQLVKANPDYANARYFLGLVYGRQGLTAQALEQFENIAKNNPDNAEIKRILSNLRTGKDVLDGVNPPASRKISEPSLAEEKKDISNKTRKK